MQSLDNKSKKPCKIPEFWEIQICIDVSMLLYSIWELLSNTLFAYTIDHMYFFQFLPEETGKNTFFQFLPFFPEETYFFQKFPNPARRGPTGTKNFESPPHQKFREKTLGRLLLGFRVLSFHNFSNLGGQLKTGHDDAFGEKRKSGLL